MIDLGTAIVGDQVLRSVSYRCSRRVTDADLSREEPNSVTGLHHGLLRVFRRPIADRIRSLCFQGGDTNSS